MVSKFARMAHGVRMKEKAGDTYSYAVEAGFVERVSNELRPNWLVVVKVKQRVNVLDILVELCLAARGKFVVALDGVVDSV